MIIRCNGCQKALEVDETRLTRDLSRGTCPDCKTIIEVRRPQAFRAETRNPAEDAPAEVRPTRAGLNAGEGSARGEKRQETAAIQTRKRFGLNIGQKLQLLFLSFIIITGGVITFLYMAFVPDMMYDQIRLRTVSIAQAFSGSISQPLLAKNYLQVNQTAMTNAGLPHVAYVSVLNNRGMVVAGLFGDKHRFDDAFRAKIESQGFPRQIAAQNRIMDGGPKREAEFTIGGQKILDVAVPIPGTGGEAHVGIFTEEVEKAVNKSLVPLLEILTIMILVGSLCFIWVARSISRPIRILTQAAEKISVGEMDHPITVTSSGEIGELADSLERMRFSINTAMDRLMQR